MAGSGNEERLRELREDIKSAHAQLRSLTASTSTELSDVRTIATRVMTWSEEHEKIDGASHVRIDDHEGRLREIEDVQAMLVPLVKHETLERDVREKREALEQRVRDVKDALEKHLRERYVPISVHDATLEELAAVKKIAVSAAARWTQAKWTLGGVALALGAGGHELAALVHLLFSK